MALQKNFTTDSGFTGNYWRVDQIILDRTSMQMVGVFHLFKSNTDRIAGREYMPGVTKTVIMPVAVNDIENYAYTQAKLLDPYFSDAVDV